MLLAGPDTCAPPLDPGIELVAASRGISEGLANTDGPQLVVRGLLDFGPVRVGGQWKNVRSPVAKGVAALFADIRRTVGATQVELKAAYRIQTDASRSIDPSAWEFSASATRRFGRFAGRAALTYSPDDLGRTGRALFVEGGSSLALDARTRLSAGAGWRWRVRAPDYGTVNVGISRQVSRQLSIDLRTYHTSRARLGSPFGLVTALSAKAAF